MSVSSVKAAIDRAVNEGERSGLGNGQVTGLEVDAVVDEVRKDGVEAGEVELLLELVTRMTHFDVPTTESEVLDGSMYEGEETIKRFMCSAQVSEPFPALHAQLANLC
jgi:hypothetical protein